MGLFKKGKGYENIKLTRDYRVYVTRELGNFQWRRYTGEVLSYEEVLDDLDRKKNNGS